MKGISIEDLTKSLKAGDSSPLQFIFEEYGAYCISTLQNTTACSPEDAEDYFVDAVMIVRQNILDGSLTELKNLRSYVYGICLNLFRQNARANKKIVHASDHDAEHFFFQEIAQDPLTEEIEEEFTQELLQTCMETLEQLSDKCRNILEDFYFLGLSMNEIAEKMNFSNASVAKTTKSRCYKKWKELINTHYQSPSI